VTWRLPDGLPAGKLVVPAPEFSDDEAALEPVLWVSDRPVPDAGDLWARLRAEHPRSGLWPLPLASVGKGSVHDQVKFQAAMSCPATKSSRA
jgi:hypothetical protein